MTIVNAGRTIYSLYKSIKKQHRFLARELNEILEEFKKNNDGSLEDADFKKITHYYGLAVPAILGDSLCALRGKKMTLKERMALTYQGAMTGLFDDFFDKYDISDEKVMSFLERPEELKGDTSVEKLFLHFYKKALLTAHNPTLVLQYLREVYNAQVESKKQANPGLSSNEILDITLKKGGVSVLFYRASMEHPFSIDEENALLQMGGLMQFGNDIFDIFKDHKSKIFTLPTTMQKTEEVRELFTTQMKKSIALTNILSYYPKNKRKYLQLIMMSLCSRCFVCLDQLKQNEKLTNNSFMIEKYSRQQLVCDMDKTKNKLNTIKQYMKMEI